MKEKNNKILIVLTALLIIILSVTLILTIIYNKRLKDEAAMQYKTNAALEESIARLESELKEIKSSQDELSWDINNHIGDTTIYDPDTGTYFYTVTYSDCGTEIIASDTGIVWFEYLYSNSGFYKNEGYLKANRVQYDNHTYTLDDAISELKVDYRMGPVIIFHSDERKAEDVTFTTEWDAARIDGYSFKPYLSKDGVLYFLIQNETGEEYARTIQPLMDEGTFFQGSLPKEWELQDYDSYLSDHEALSTECTPIDIVDVMNELTGKEISQYDRKCIELFFELIQDKFCYVPGAMSADGYDQYFRFDMVDLDKDGTREILIDKGFNQMTVYIPRNNWTDSLAYSNITRVNVKEGIINECNGDIGGYQNYYRFTGFDSEILASLIWNVTESGETPGEYKDVFSIKNPDNTAQEISEEEYIQARYGVTGVYDSQDISWKELTPSTILTFFFE